jgi:DNA-binding CsgD family transcriptional regulator
VDDRPRRLRGTGIEEPGELARRVRGVSEADGWPEATRLISRHWDQMGVIAPREVLDAIHALPAEAILGEPGLVVAANYLQHVLIDGDTSRFAHDSRIDGMVATAETPLVQRLVVMTARLSTARNGGDFDSVVRIICAARKDVDGSTPEERAQIASTLPHLRLQWARALDFGDRAGAGAEYEAAYEQARLTDQPFLARRAASHLAWYEAAQGRLAIAESWISLAEEVEQNTRYDAPLLLARALIDVDRNDFHGAAVERVRLSVTPLGEYWAASLWVAMLGARTAAEATPIYAELEHEIDRHSHAERSAPANVRYLHAARLRLALLRRGGRLAALATPTTSIAHLAAATEALHQGAYERSESHGALAVEHAKMPRGLASGLLVRAAALEGLGRPRQAVDVALEAQAVMDSARLYSPYRLLPPGMLDRLAKRMPAHVGERVLTLAHGRRAPEVAALTPRQADILRALVSDEPLADIAESLFISRNTLKSALATIYGTLGVNTRHQAADVARRSGL